MAHKNTYPAGWNTENFAGEMDARIPQKTHTKVYLESS